jgi:hypothetical protein
MRTRLPYHEGAVDEGEDLALVPAELLGLVGLDSPLVHHLHGIQLAGLTPLAACRTIKAIIVSISSGMSPLLDAKNGPCHCHSD